MPEIIVHDSLLGFMKIYILHFASKEELYGKDFHDQMLKMGYEVSYGTIYPIFHKMEQKGYLRHCDKNVNGKIRKYYSLTDHGKKALEASKKRIREMVDVLNQ